MTMSDTVRSVRTQEIFRYDGYPVTFVMFEVFGFGKPMEHDAIMSMPGVQSGTWGPPVRMIADRLGVELDEIRETYEKVVTPRTLEVAAGTIEAGTVGAVRFETIGVVHGRDAIVIEHVNRMASDLAPEWPTAARDGTYRIMVEGNPDLTCELTVGQPATASDDGMVATTMRLVNAIPYVCDAPPAWSAPSTCPSPPRSSPSTDESGGAEGAGVGGGDGGLEGGVVEGVGDVGEGDAAGGAVGAATWRAPGRR